MNLILFISLARYWRWKSVFENHLDPMLLFLSDVSKSLILQEFTTEYRGNSSSLHAGHLRKEPDWKDKAQACVQNQRNPLDRVICKLNVARPIVIYQLLGDSFVICCKPYVISWIAQWHFPHKVLNGQGSVW